MLFRSFFTSRPLPRPQRLRDVRLLCVDPRGNTPPPPPSKCLLVLPFSPPLNRCARSSLISPAPLSRPSPVSNVCQTTLSRSLPLLLPLFDLGETKTPTASPLLMHTHAVDSPYPDPLRHQTSAKSTHLPPLSCPGPQQKRQ